MKLGLKNDVKMAREIEGGKRKMLEATLPLDRWM